MEEISSSSKTGVNGIWPYTLHLATPVARQMAKELLMRNGTLAAEHILCNHFSDNGGCILTLNRLQLQNHYYCFRNSNLDATCNGNLRW